MWIITMNFDSIRVGPVLCYLILHSTMYSTVQKHAGDGIHDDLPRFPVEV